MSIWKPVNKKFMPYSIMLFSAFSNNVNDNIDKEYSDYVMPTVIENVSYTRNAIYQNNNNGIAPLGSYTLIIDMSTSKFYRNIEGVKTEIEYLEPLIFGSKGFDEQTKKYFTIKQKISSFILGVYEKYNDGVKVAKKSINSISFKKIGYTWHSITNIDIGGFDDKPDILTLTGNIEI